MKPALSKAELDDLISADANTIGLMLAARYAPFRGADGVCLARDIKDVIVGLRRASPPRPSKENQE